MPTIPPRFLDEIRARVLVSGVVGARLRITRAGHEWKACCPFHHEKTPSFTINDDKGFYHCFGCGAHGDVIRFLMDHDKMGFMEAVESLAAQAGLEVPKPTPEEAAKAQQEQKQEDAVEATAQFFEHTLKGPPLDYLLSRGITPQTIKDFRLGYAPADGSLLPQHLKNLGFGDAEMRECGLVRDSTKTKGVYAFFRDRVMFPVKDRKGHVVAFGGRVLPPALRAPDFGGHTPPKYINSPDTPLFDKSCTLFAAHEAKKAARGGHSILIVEGYMDAIACHQAGFKGAVAPMGTALTAQQLALAWSLPGAGAENAPSPVLCLDGDEAGQRAASRAVARALPLLSAHKTLRIALLPQGQDPDSLLREGGAPALRRVLEGSLSLMDFLWSAHIGGRDLTTPEARARAKAHVMEAIGTIEDREIAAHYRSMMHERFSKAFFQKGRKSATPPTPTGRIPIRATPRTAHVAAIERALIAALLNHPYIYSMVEETLGRMHITDPDLDSLRCALIAALEDTPDMDNESLKAHMRTLGHQKVIDDILCASVYVHAGFAAPNAESPCVAASWLALAQEVEAVQEQAGKAKGLWF